MAANKLDTPSLAEIAEARRDVTDLARLVSRAQDSTEMLKISLGRHKPLEVKLASLKTMLKVVEAASLAIFPCTETHDEEISPEQAAKILSFSRPTVMRLVDKGLLAARKVNTHFRLSKNEVLKFKEENAMQRRHALTEMAKMSEEYDF